MSESPFTWLLNGLAEQVQFVLHIPDRLFDAWLNALASLPPMDPFGFTVTSWLLGGLILVLTILNAASMYSYLSDIIRGKGPFRRNLAILAIYTATTTVLLSLGVTAAFAPNVHSAIDFLAAWTLVASWPVPATLLVEALLIAYVFSTRRRTHYSRTQPPRTGRY